jgi:hypothetical protein
MPRDEFERLERRWREQPLFLPRRRRLPRWPLVLLVAVLAAALLGQVPTAGLIERLQQALAAGMVVAPGSPQAGAVPKGTGSADAGLAKAPGAPQGNQARHGD